MKKHSHKFQVKFTSPIYFTARFSKNSNDIQMEVLQPEKPGGRILYTGLFSPHVISPFFTCNRFRPVLSLLRQSCVYIEIILDVVPLTLTPNLTPFPYTITPSHPILQTLTITPNRSVIPLYTLTLTLYTIHYEFSQS